MTDKHVQNEIIELRKKYQQLEENLRDSQYLLDLITRNKLNDFSDQVQLEQNIINTTPSTEDNVSELINLINYQQELSKISFELDEIKSSKAWKFALHLRRIREIIIPRNSILESIAKVIYRMVLTPRKFVQFYVSYRKNFNLIKKTEMFDEKWYVSHNPDVAQSAISPIKHYLLFGGFEGRDPSPDFSSQWYLEKNQDVGNAGINPLIHFLQFGKKEGREPKEISKSQTQQKLADQNPEAHKYAEIIAVHNPEDPAVIPNIRLFGIIGTWMEEDIIEATIQNALTQGCERVYIVDNDSTDDTVTIALKNGAILAKTFSSKQYDESERLYLMNAVMKDISNQEDDEHLWWLFIDADEFPHGPSGLTILSYLQSLDDQFRVVGSRFFNHYPSAEPAYLPGRHPIDFQPLCEEINMPMCPQGHRKHQLLRFDKDSISIEAGLGFHCVISHQPVIEPHQPIFCHHFPFRDKDITYQRLTRLWQKSENGESRADPHSFVTTHMLARLKSFNAVYNQDWDSIINFVSIDPISESDDKKKALTGVSLKPWTEIIPEQHQSILRWYSMLDNWNYDKLPKFNYGNDTSYIKGLEFLDGQGDIEDWGSGFGYAKRFIKKSNYVGIDGSFPEADKKADLTSFTSNVDCIFMRHVLEHNTHWATILKNAVSSFRKRMVLILFTPFSETTHPLCMSDGLTAFPVPDISFRREELIGYFEPFIVKEETIATDTQYGIEHIFYLEKVSNCQSDYLKTRSGKD